MMRRYLLAMGLVWATLSSGQGIVKLVAGGGTGTYCGDGGAAVNACLNQPSGLASDSAGNIYIADTANHRIRKITPGGVISTVAGNGVAGYSGDNLAATIGSLNMPSSVAVDFKGRIYILDSGNNRIRMVGTNGVISTVAGSGGAGYSGDIGPAVQAQINPGPGSGGIALDKNGNIYLTDTLNNRIRFIGSAGGIATIAGGLAGFSG